MRNILGREFISNDSSGLLQVLKKEIWRRKKGFFNGPITSSFSEEKHARSKNCISVLDYWNNVGAANICDIKIEVKK